MSFLEGGEVAGWEVILGDPAGSSEAGWAHSRGAPETMRGWREAKLEEGVAGVDVDGDPFAGSGLAPFEEAHRGHGRGMCAADLQEARYGGAAVEVSCRDGDRTDSV